MTEEKKPTPVNQPAMPAVAKKIGGPTTPKVFQNINARNTNFKNMGRNPGVKRANRAAKGR